ncbi:hypothetical protein HF521_022219 [Silurus meridionalis]|uniref:Uncharacterized protein n=1 Tax=Silurus meridionalis TaxID=175797 RepID=A0A8T0B8P4_SILME|nr:hypothetical protein HF521_022219 [Silurus meridionalis]
MLVKKESISFPRSLLLINQKYSIQASMILIKRAAEDGFQYELTVMAQHLIEYYPMLLDKSATNVAEWESVKKQLLKRLQNVTTPKKKQGPFKEKATKP